jgi:hypothetical protein
MIGRTASITCSTKALGAVVPGDDPATARRRGSKWILTIWAMLAILFLPVPALAWGPEGHSIIAELAQHRLTKGSAEPLMSPRGRSRSSADATVTVVRLQYRASTVRLDAWSATKPVG